MILLAFVLTILIVQRLSELVLANRNYRWAMQNGGKEFGADHYWLFVVLHSLWLVCMTLEWLIRQPPVPNWWPVCLILIVAAQVLRYWAITAPTMCYNSVCTAR